MTIKNKVILYFLGAILLLVFAPVGVALLLQVPSVQNAAIHLVITQANKRIQGKIALEHIGIALPRSIDMSGLLILDSSNDTILAASKVRVRMEFVGLIRGKINLRYARLSDCSVKIDRKEGEERFTIQNLVPQKNKQGKLRKQKVPGVNKMSLQVKKLRLNNIRFVFADRRSGVFVATKVGRCALTMNSLSLENLSFGVDNIQVDSPYCAVRISRKTSAPNKRKPTIVNLPRITVNSCKLTDACFAFDDSIARNSIRITTGAIDLGKGAIDINTGAISAGNTAVRDADVGIVITGAKTTQNRVVSVPNRPKVDHKWRVDAGAVNVSDCRFDLDLDAMPRRQKGFDPGHMHLRGIAVQAKAAYYAAREIRATVAHAAVRDSTGITVKKFKVLFSLNTKGISTQNLMLSTNASTIRATARTDYSPFALHNGILPGQRIFLALQPSVLSTDELCVFAPLDGIPPFKGDAKKITISGTVDGTVASLKTERLRLSYGTYTNLQTDFRIDGLPNANNSEIDVPSLILHTSGQDVRSLLGKDGLPRGVSIPSQVGLQASFKGSQHSFRSTVDLESDFGAINGKLVLDRSGRYSGALSVRDLNPGQFFQKAAMMGKTTLSSSFDGRGFDMKKLSASIHINAPSIHFKNYTYSNCVLDAKIDGQKYSGALSLRDKNLALDLGGMMLVAKGREAVQCSLDLRNADCAQLRLLKDNVYVSGKLMADLTGTDLKNISGRIALHEISLEKNGVACHYDSLLGSITSTPHMQTFAIRSDAFHASYKGLQPATESFRGLLARIDESLPMRFHTPDSVAVPLHDFSLEIQVRDHPLFSGFLLPKLTAFQNGNFIIRYAENGKKCRAEAGIQYFSYGGITYSDARASTDRIDSTLTYDCSIAGISNAQIDFGKIELRGTSRMNRATLTISAIGERFDTALFASLSALPSENGLTLMLDPDCFYLGDLPWTVSRDNYAALNKNALTIHHLAVSRKTSMISIASAGASDSGALRISVKDFALKLIAQMLQKDSTFIGGTLNADISLGTKRNTASQAIDLDCRDIVVQNARIGSLSLTANAPQPRQYRFAAGLSGQENDVAINGSLSLATNKPALDLQATIRSLTVKSIEPFTRGAFCKSTGTLMGAVSCTGSITRPLLNGKLAFKDVSVTPVALNSTIRLNNETVDIINSGLYFTTFSVRDQRNRLATVTGGITLDSLGRAWFDVKANARDFLLLNTTQRDNPVVYGRLIIDCQATIHGTAASPVIDSRIALKAPSHLTFAVPETNIKTDRGENVVVFAGRAQSPNAERISANTRKAAPTFKGIELTSAIEADPGVSLRIIPDPYMRDTLAVRGSAALNLGLDKSGKISLTGAYYLSDGRYTVTLPPLISKNFSIGAGSSIVWNGNLTDATVSIVARYSASAAPIDLFPKQTGVTDLNQFRKPLRFETILALSGSILKPSISFTLDLAPEDKGALDGTVDARLSQINQDPTMLNRQVFALLVLGQFLPEGPADQFTAGGQLASVARSSVSSFLTVQLNQWGASILPGVQLNFDVQSYEDSSSGKTIGKTLVDLGAKKQLFNDRLSIEIGGTIDMQGQKPDQNAAKDIGGNMAIEYKLTEDGMYSLKGFRRMQYEGALEGQVTETGAGVVYSRSFNSWRQLFIRPKKDATIKK